MKRALFVGVTNSPYLYFLRILMDREDPWFDAKKSEFDKVIFYTADVILQESGEDMYILDTTGSKLRHLGVGVYQDDILGKPEIPEEIRSLGSEKEVSYAQ